jgi:hypothetical protein
MISFFQMLLTIVHLRRYTPGAVAGYADVAAACDASTPEQKLECDALEDCVGFSRRRSGCAFWILKDSNLRAYDFFHNKVRRYRFRQIDASLNRCAWIHSLVRIIRTTDFKFYFQLPLALLQKGVGGRRA